MWSSRLLVAAAGVLLASTAGLATDVGVTAKKLVIVDGGVGGKDKLSFVAKGANLTKGAGTDIDAISAHVEILRRAAGGAFSIPSGALGSSGHGWRQNDPTLARYQNADAATGIPTSARSLLLRPGKVLKLTTRGLGDDPLDFAALAAEGSTLRTIATIVNGDERIRHCSAFAASNITTKEPNGSGRAKLVAKKGTAAACPGLVLSPTPTLPPTPAAPHLYFDGANPAEIAALAARVVHPATSGHFSSFRSTVDNVLASLGSASDDTRSKVAKGAGLLHVLGETPPGGSGFTSYRDVAVTALLGMSDRTALDSVDEFLNPPPNLLHVLQDSGRLQSMAEAYDFLRGSGVAPGEDTTIRALLASWADAYVEDWNLIGDPFGVFPGHTDNWGIKAGSALVTVALALPDHPSAPVWLGSGMAYLNDSLREVVTAPGWYTESPHYVNYSLNNLASTAWHVENATNGSWFDDLAPLVDVALALRQPDGQSAAFEEGVPNDFPYDVLAAAYPTRAPRMLWAWEQSGQNPANYDNQQIHSVTRFLVEDLATAAAAPSDPPTVFLAGDTHAAALRSGWDANATQITTIAALDHSDQEVFPSRHNMENPLDVTLFAAGAILLPTASGGPEVTSSANRAVYLEPGAKNIPLVDGNAPYLLDPLSVEFGERIDSADAGGIAHRALDAVTTRIDAFAPGVAAERTVALIDDTLGAVVDRFESTAVHTYGGTWRGRGDAVVRTLATDHLGVDYDFPTTAAPTAHLAVDVAGSTSLSGTVDTGLYAPAWGVEESVAPLRVSASANSAHFLTLLRPRAAAAPTSTITSVGGGNVAAFRVTEGAAETVIATAGGAPLTADGATSDGLLAIVARAGGVTSSLAMVRGTAIDAGPSGGSVECDAATTLSITSAAGAAVLEVSADVLDKRRITLQDIPGLSGGAGYTATFDGEPLTGSSFSQSGSQLQIRVPHGGTVVIDAVP